MPGKRDDIDVAILRHDQLALFGHLRGWDLRYATPVPTLEEYDARHPWIRQLRG